jgi:hypothetical protein
MDNMKYNYLLPITGVALALLGSSLSANAADATPTSTNHWESSISAGATLTRGNSKTFLGTVTGVTGK